MSLLRFFLSSPCFKQICKARRIFVAARAALGCHRNCSHSARGVTMTYLMWCQSSVVVARLAWGQSSFKFSNEQITPMHAMPACCWMCLPCCYQVPPSNVLPPWCYHRDSGNSQSFLHNDKCTASLIRGALGISLHYSLCRMENDRPLRDPAVTIQVLADSKIWYRL